MRFDSHERFLRRKDSVLHETDDNAHCGAAAAGDTDTIQNMHMAVFDDEFDLHFLSQLLPHQGGMTLEVGEGRRRDILQ
jgi:hypothetical protein